MIPVAVQFISDNKGGGNIPEAWLDAQIEVLNRTYGGKDYDGRRVRDAANTGYTFYKASVDRTRSNAWYMMLPGSNHEYKAKLNLGISTTTTLNFYTAAPGYGILGWATFPEWLYLPMARLGRGWSLVLEPGADHDLQPGGRESMNRHCWAVPTFQGVCGRAVGAGCSTRERVCYTAPAQPHLVSEESNLPASGLDPIHNYCLHL